MLARIVLLLLVAALSGFTGCKTLCTSGCGSPFGGPKGCADCQADCGSCHGSGCGACLAAAKQCLHDKLTCGSGCGTLVLDEWYDNPPDACDPCDNWGGWTGNRICPPTIHDCRAGCATCDVAVGKGIGKGVELISPTPSLATPTETGEPSGTQSSEPANNSAAPRATRPDGNAGPPQDVARSPRRRHFFQ